jgi:nucleoside-diphosphate-sugar epimerase
MVLGSGLVANGFKAYKNDENYLIFASGVSNSANTNKDEFARERDLLKKAISDHPKKILVYFSTCSIYDHSLQHSLYVHHKREMETIIREDHPRYHIFRVSNLVGNTDNPHTVLNFFVQHINSGEPFFVWRNASRNIIDIDDAVVVCNYILKHDLFRNEIVNIASPSNYSVAEIVQTIEDVVGRKGNYEGLDKGSQPDIDTDPIQEIFTVSNIRFDGEYLRRTIKKYFGNR